MDSAALAAAAAAADLAGRRWCEYRALDLRARPSIPRVGGGQLPLLARATGSARRARPSLAHGAGESGCHGARGERCN